jgi:ATP:cob(I)alamin adenosyltransferase
MKIYTKTGDQGLTSLIGGVRVSKAHLRIESYGTVDELNSWIGLLRARQSNAAMDALLNDIQNQLFVIGSHLAADPEKSRMSLPEWELSYTEKLEQSIDEMMQTLPELRNFVLPGGNEAARHRPHRPLCLSPCRAPRGGPARSGSCGTVFGGVFKSSFRLSFHTRQKTVRRCWK